MATTWQEAVMLLHMRGWSGELIDEACTGLVEACAEGVLEGKRVRDLTPQDAQTALREPVAQDEVRALLLLAELHERADAEGNAFRAALRDLDAFADSLGEG